VEEIMTTVRLPVEIESKLTILAEKKHKSKSEIIKEALDNLFYKEEIEKDSYEIGESYFGQYGSGDGSLSVTYRNKLKDKINAKINPH
jgi:predicted DNA-binding protein